MYLFDLLTTKKTMIMKFINRNWRMTGVLILLVSLTGCKKFVQLDTPPTLLVASAVFNDNTTATQAQTNIYSQMSSNQESYNMSNNSGLLSDELTGYAASGQQRQFYINAMISANVYFGPWGPAYNYIYQANAVLEGLQNSHGVSVAVKNQLSGEAKFIRAFWHFNLTNCYGNVPLVTTTAYATNARLARTPQPLVYEQIIADLKDAQGLLSNHYVDFSDTATTTERTRPTLWAADALLARVYLYAKQYVLAEAAATAVIAHADLYGLEPDLSNVFLANSQEAIWQLQIPLPNNGQATYDGANFILQADPNGSGGVSVSPQLLNSFEAGDKRRTNWVHDTTFAGTPYAYPYKYKQGINVSTVAEYGMVLRLAEQYLIRAEARAYQGKLPEAIADLNAIRNRAGLGNYVGSATDPAAILGAILHERQVELFTEWGHRWFDLIRTGTVNSVMGVVTPLKGGTWDPDRHQTLYPIPQIELGKDNNLTQNPGY
jgi:hypothetical protein